MPKESVLTEAEKQSFVIEKFVFHVIIQEDFDPIYLDEVELSEAQNEFFKRRFIDISEGTQFKFSDPYKSDLYGHCKEMLANPEKNFLDKSKRFAYAFKEQHNKSTNDGVFITALVKIGTVRLIFLIKVDNRVVYQYKIHRNRAALEEIKNTFVEDKKTVQKAAIIDISGSHVWEVLAWDRTLKSSEAGITDYFRKFLTVMEIETATTLTSKVLKEVNRWAMINQLELDPAQDTSSYKTRAIGYLSNTTVFRTKDLLDMVIQDQDSERRDKLLKSLKDHLDNIGLSGQSFKPSVSALTNAKKKNIRQTAEGVKLEWTGDPSDANLEIAKDRDKQGLIHILIKTSEVRNIDSKS